MESARIQITDQWLAPEIFKGEGHSRKLTCFVNIQLFYSPQFQPLKCLLLGEIRLERTTSKRGRHFKLSWQPSHVYETSFGPTQNWWEDLASFTRSRKSIFSEPFSTVLSYAIISEFRACLAQKNVTQEQP